ncbi:ankyrin repeat domain-containing protein [Wolbachia endosymbiont of Folsomia candida]|uniref:ankyrin repeat domain-containing protein n=1 Tax=Wolbachia endosymbiont of Folsomia candida TaxID=169402 RepID=UPI000A487F20|nr:ankyrin repeat domain-containing protein [Wolbachia endosymbiont of Folsomia candida]APR98934.1 hypothetical protein ASM33_07025 [Wolbachia endosymbiont of Folsomia candida]
MRYCPNYDMPIHTSYPSDYWGVRAAFFAGVRQGYDLSRFYENETFLYYKIGPNTDDGYGNQPLHWAQNIKTILFLIDKGADVNAIAKNSIAKTEYTALHCASAQGNKEIVDVLTLHNADVNIKGKGGYTPLHLSGNKEVAGLLIKHGANVNAKDHNDFTPLHAAAKECRVEVAKFLIEKGADINAKDDSGYIPLQYAIEKQCKEIENLLIQHIDIYQAVEHGYQAVVKSLIEHGTYINAIDNKGYTPLHWAKDVKMVDFLIKNGADINAIDKQGYTMLHWAAKKGYQEIAELLIRKNADIIESKDGNLPSKLATNELIRAKLESYEKGEALKEVKDKLIEEKEEMKATLEKKLKEVMEEKTTALEKLLKLQKGMRELQEEEPLIEKVLSEVKEEFSKCHLAKSLDSIVNQLDTINSELPVIAEYSSQSGRASFENTIDYVLKNIDSLEDKTKSKVVVAVTNMLNMLKKCGSQSEEKLDLIIDNVNYINDNMIRPAGEMTYFSMTGTMAEDNNSEYSFI